MNGKGRTAQSAMRPDHSSRGRKGRRLMLLLEDLAAQKGCTVASLSLAWMLHKYPNVVPIPGMRREERVVENLKASDIVLTDEEFNNIEKELNKITIYGNRTDEDIHKLGSVKAMDFNN